MVAQTICKNYYVGQTARVKCVKNDRLADINVKEDCFLLLAVYEGSAVFRVGDTSFSAKSPCLVCFDENEKPKLIKKNELRCDAVYFHPSFLNSNMTFEQLRNEKFDSIAIVSDVLLMKPFTDKKRFVFPLLKNHTENMNSLFSKLYLELEQQGDLYWPYRARSFFVEIIRAFEKLYRIMESHDMGVQMNNINNPYLRNAVIYIEGHYDDDVSLENISQAAAINHSTLTQLFKNELKVTPVEYLWLYRTSMAKKQLAFTTLSIKAISEMCGFKTSSHFSRKFESLTGSSPKNYRKQCAAI